jgi:hypothetical protein
MPIDEAGRRQAQGRITPIVETMVRRSGNHKGTADLLGDGFPWSSAVRGPVCDADPDDDESTRPDFRRLSQFHEAFATA